VIITDELARRLEHAEAVDAAGCVEAACRLEKDCDAAANAAAGGYLTFCGVESPLTHAIGVGMHGPLTAGDVDEVEHFFRSRKAPVSIDVCPHADPSLYDLLCQRGYRITEFHNVLVRTLPVDLPQSSESVHIRAGHPDDYELYASTVVRGFFGRDEMTEEELRLGRLLFRMPCTTGYLAIRDDGEAIAAAGLSIRNGVANFFGDATLRSARGRGAHSALIRERLQGASQAGCDLAMAGTQPGSTSQRNYQRLGFQVAYTKCTMVGPA
jgi:hypothetical protein